MAAVSPSSTKYSTTNSEGRPNSPGQRWMDNLDKDGDGVIDKDEMKPNTAFSDASRARVPEGLRFIINPKSQFQTYWDLLMVVLLVFTATVTPYEVGFLETNLDTQSGLVLFAINRIVDFGFILDLPVQFMTPFYDQEQGGFVLDHKKIAWRYISSWMLIDVVSILPFDSIG
jgi:hypothetical protein